MFNLNFTIPLQHIKVALTGYHFNQQILLIIFVVSIQACTINVNIALWKQENYFFFKILFIPNKHEYMYPKLLQLKVSQNSPQKIMFNA